MLDVYALLPLLRYKLLIPPPQIFRNIWNIWVHNLGNFNILGDSGPLSPNFRHCGFAGEQDVKLTKPLCY